MVNKKQLFAVMLAVGVAIISTASVVADSANSLKNESDTELSTINNRLENCSAAGTVGNIIATFPVASISGSLTYEANPENTYSVRLISNYYGKAHVECGDNNCSAYAGTVQCNQGEDLRLHAQSLQTLGHDARVDIYCAGNFCENLNSAPRTNAPTNWEESNKWVRAGIVTGDIVIVGIYAYYFKKLFCPAFIFGSEDQPLVEVR